NEEVLDDRREREARACVRFPLVLRPPGIVRKERLGRRNGEARPVLPVAQIDRVRSHVPAASGTALKTLHGSERRAARRHGRFRALRACPGGPRPFGGGLLGPCLLVRLAQLADVVVFRVRWAVIGGRKSLPILALQRLEERRTRNETREALGLLVDARVLHRDEGFDVG